MEIAWGIGGRSGGRSTERPDRSARQADRLSFSFGAEPGLA